MRRRLAELDAAAYRRIHDTPSPRWVDRGWAHYTHAADHSKLWMVAAAILATRGRPGRRAALRGLVSVGLASATANQVGKRLLPRVRPDLTLVERVRLPRRRPTSGSFPSGHSASAAAFAVGAASEMPVLAVPLGVAAAAVGYSRVHTGVHFPGDVLAGFALGAGVAFSTRTWWPLAEDGAHLVAERTIAAPRGRGLTVVVNAAAGPERSSPEDEIREALPEAEVVALDDPERLVKTLREAAHDAVALGVCGGDGTVNAAAEVAYDAGLPLAVFPGGTLNHLARDLGIASVEDTARAVEAGSTVDMDVAEIDGRPFLNTASFGAYADLVDARERREGRIGKWPALAVALATVLREAEPLEVEINGRPARIRAIFLGNCRYSPAGFLPASRTRLDDGLIDVRVLGAGFPRTKLATELRIRSAEPLRLARDGETFDGSTEFVIRKREKRLRVYTP